MVPVFFLVDGFSKEAILKYLNIIKRIKINDYEVDQKGKITLPRDQPKIGFYQKLIRYFSNV